MYPHTLIEVILQLLEAVTTPLSAGDARLLVLVAGTTAAHTMTRWLQVLSNLTITFALEPEFHHIELFEFAGDL
ncbi:hypothetical protein [Leptodesmis sichuanensis]|uniref:hypothetical protein n=1 Tax=Leptodesmis sichuanensis TaxID=2906798 RepID=UPI001F45F5A9|nr:hypothetical protein [Leptodesmis sichuanensis]UIE38454.1 hypothetical protein KIK02_02000 [Leptodesmis sichuanensis A121]